MSNDFYRALKEKFRGSRERVKSRLRDTAPLRWGVLQARLLRGYGLSSRIKALFKKIARPFIRRCIIFIKARPSLRSKTIVLAHRLGMYHSIRTVYDRILGHGPITRGFPSSAKTPTLSVELSQLTPRAREIFAELKAAIKNQQESR